MVFVPAPGVCQVNMRYQSPGGIAENVFHVRHVDGSAWTGSDIGALLADMGAWEDTDGRHRRAAPVINISILGRDLTTEHGAESSYSGEHVGDLAGAPLPMNCTLAIKKVTGISGRSYRGRTYWIGLSRNFQSGDQYDGAETTAIINSLLALRTAVNVDPTRELVLLRSQEAGVVLNPRLGQPITDFQVVDTTIDSQRRRLLGRGM